MMNARKRLAITAAAERDLYRIYEHIAADSSTEARRQVARILRAADMLRDFPDIGADRSHLDDGLRSVVERPFVAFYYPNDTTIFIARVIHQRQDIEAELLAYLQRDFDSPIP